MNSLAWLTISTVLISGSSTPPASENGNASVPDRLLLAEAEVFREVAAKVRLSLVRIETVGGAQPQEDRPKRPDAANDDAPGVPTPPPRTQNPFQDNPGSPFLLADGPTTGIVYSKDGLILTSSFNFVREPALVSVTLADGRRLAADLVARDQVRKLALLKVDADDLTPATWVPLDEIRIGQRAIALGVGFGGDAPSITIGIVSAKNRMMGNAVQTDAKLSPANYGGPLCDWQGRVLGIAAPLAQRPGELAGVEMYDSGVGFVLPKETVDPIAAQLKSGRSFYRGWLGMVFDPNLTDRLVIANIADPSPGRTAGARIGDRLVRLNGRELRHYGQLVQNTYMLPAGEQVLLELDRHGATISIEVVLARSTELGPLPKVSEPLDAAEPNVALPEPSDEPSPEDDGEE